MPKIYLPRPTSLQAALHHVPVSPVPKAPHAHFAYSPSAAFARFDPPSAEAVSPRSSPPQSAHSSYWHPSLAPPACAPQPPPPASLQRKAPALFQAPHLPKGSTMPLPPSRSAKPAYPTSEKECRTATTS